MKHPASAGRAVVVATVSGLACKHQRSAGLAAHVVTTALTTAAPAGGALLVALVAALGSCVLGVAIGHGIAKGLTNLGVGIQDAGGHIGAGIGSMIRRPALEYKPR